MKNEYSIEDALAQAEYELFQGESKKMQEQCTNNNEEMAQAIPFDLTIEEKINTLHEILIPHLGKFAALKERYDALGTLEELEELAEKVDDMTDDLESKMEKFGHLLEVHDNMCLEVENYEAKGWHVVLMDDESFQGVKSMPSLASGQKAKMITEEVPCFYGEEDEKREMNFLYVLKKN